MDKNFKEKFALPKKEIKGLRTYAKDLGESVVSQKGGIIKMAISDEAKKGAEEKNISFASAKNKIFLIGSIALVAGGILSIIFLWPKNQTVIAPQAENQNQPIIFSDSNKIIDITGIPKERIIQNIRSEIASAQIPSHKIKNIMLTETISGASYLIQSKRFFSSIGSAIPQALLQALAPKFMLGFHSEVGNQPFILLKTNSFNDAYQGMLAWEERMFDDLYLMFAIDISGDNIKLFDKKFEDSIVQNKNARVIKDAEGSIILMYAFLNNQTAAIATNSDTLGELINRLNAQKIEQ